MSIGTTIPKPQIVLYRPTSRPTRLTSRRFRGMELLSSWTGVQHIAAFGTGNLVAHAHRNASCSSLTVPGQDGGSPRPRPLVATYSTQGLVRRWQRRRRYHRRRCGRGASSGGSFNRRRGAGAQRLCHPAAGSCSKERVGLDLPCLSGKKPFFKKLVIY